MRLYHCAVPGIAGILRTGYGFQTAYELENLVVRRVRRCIAKACIAELAGRLRGTAHLQGTV